MELTFDELKKRDVINVADGRSLGSVIDLRLSFPKGVLLGIYVPGRKRSGLFGLFDKSSVYISENRIIKIGGDVILVNLDSGEVKAEKPPCPPPCPPKCVPCSPPCPPNQPRKDSIDGEFSIFGSVEGRIDTGDY